LLLPTDIVYYFIDLWGYLIVKILFLEPFYGGSHKDFALGLKNHSRHDVSLITLPDRFWKWRMTGAACYFADKIKNFSDYDAIFTTDMLNLSDLQALVCKKLPPVLIYFHENQLSYPLAPKQKYDINLSFSNIISAVTANTVLFNSKFHFNAFIDAALHLIKQMPDAQPLWMIERLKQRVQIVYPGCRFGTGKIAFGQEDITKPLIIWNHRWDHDKNFEFFFDVLTRLKEKNIPFTLALLGEHYKNYPDIFKRAREEFKNEILVYGYLESKDEYISWLKKGAVVVSCAIQENFGISVVEAVRYGCIPLLPDRLSYPELIPKDIHSKILYHTKREMNNKLEDMIINYQKYFSLKVRLSRHMEQFSWEIMKNQYDEILENL
jgi:glycosyltransferase involved in cell wall biosynthesis